MDTWKTPFNIYDQRECIYEDCVSLPGFGNLRSLCRRYTCVNLAKNIGFNNVAEVLKQTLAEDREADARLTHIAEKNVNYQAGMEPNP